MSTTAPHVTSPTARGRRRALVFVITPDVDMARLLLLLIRIRPGSKNHADTGRASEPREVDTMKPDEVRVEAGVRPPITRVGAHEQSPPDPQVSAGLQIRACRPPV